MVLAVARFKMCVTVVVMVAILKLKKGNYQEIGVWYSL